MGGGYYDREVISADSNTGFSAESAKTVGVEQKLHSSLDPKRWAEEPLTSDVLCPIVFALDVTGSMGDWSRIIYDKMPMFYGQIMIQQYLKEPAVSFCAVGDYTCDEAPLQVSEFGEGKEIDQLIGKIYLEGNGGNTYFESYELPAYFYLKNTRLVNGVLPFFFITGDEAFYEKIPKTAIEKHLGMSCCQEQSVDSFMVWKDLLKKYNVFLIKKPYYDNSLEKEIYKQWCKAIGEERILSIQTPKACIDVILGAIALTSEERTLDGYIKDMIGRGQEKVRIEEVTKALKPYWDKLHANKLQVVKTIELPITLEALTKKAFKLKSTGLSEDNLALSNKLIELKQNIGNNFPEHFLCPITKEPLVDPVISEDEETYERYAIERWFDSGNKASPLDKDKLIGNKLIPNLAVKNLIKKLLEKNQK